MMGGFNNYSTICERNAMRERGEKPSRRMQEGWMINARTVVGRSEVDGE